MDAAEKLLTTYDPKRNGCELPPKVKLGNKSGDMTLDFRHVGIMIDNADGE